MRKITFVFLFVTIISYSQCNTLISSGHRHTILLKDNGIVQTWGYDLSGFGVLGLGNNLNVTTPTQVGTSLNNGKIFTGNYNTFIIKTNGTLWATGNNEEGQLGNGSYGSGNVSNIFIQIGTETNWKTISPSAAHTLGIKNDGTLWAWGSNQQGKLGDGTFTNRYTPIQIGTDTNWKEVASGLQYSVAIKTDGTLWVWGLNNANMGGSSLIPRQIGIDTDWKEISTDAAGLHTLALKNNGKLYAFGKTWSGGNGALGLGSTILVANTPMQIGLDSDWQSISAGFNNSFAIKTNGTLWGWGQNDLGQLGDGTQIDKLTPTQIGLQSDWMLVSAGQRHTVALKSNGDLYTWGDNSLGQLGNGNYSSTITPLFINSCTLSLNEFATEKFVVYPNPVKNNITIEFNTKCKYSSIEIIDSIGRIVMIKDSTEMDKITLDVSQLTNGIYIVVVKDNYQIILSKKLIKE